MPGSSPMLSYQESEIVNACRILFGSGVEITREFVQYLQPEGVRRAYRNRARECHPDLRGDRSSQDVRTELFRRSVEAYELLNEFLRNRQVVQHQQPRPAERRSQPKPKPWIRPAKAPNERYYSGPFPTIRLRTGLFLYYRGAVSYQALVRSLLWQRSLRPPLGEFACSWGWIDQEAVATILSATHLLGSFGERALKLGLLSESQLKILLLHQRFTQQPIGRYFVQHALLTESELLRYLRELSRHNALVGTNR